MGVPSLNDLAVDGTLNTTNQPNLIDKEKNSLQKNCDIINQQTVYQMLLILQIDIKSNTFKKEPSLLTSCLATSAVDSCIYVTCHVTSMKTPNYMIPGKFVNKMRNFLHQNFFINLVQSQCIL